MPPGEFEMGSPLAEPGRSADEGTRRVQLTRAFEIGATEVTVAQWRAVMGLGGDPSETAGCGTSCPANGMRWDSALSYANALSAREGLPPCYELTGCTGSILTGTLACTGANVIGGATVYDCIGYRLPTEAEWEYATRAGTSTAFWSGANTNPRDDCAPVAALSTAGWSCADGGEGAETVGARSANAWGLHDVHGNVWEFVWDGYALYGSGAAVDPVRNTGSSRVARGGGWSSVPRDCRSATRVARAMAFANSSHGFRVVRTIHLRSE